MATERERAIENVALELGLLKYGAKVYKYRCDSDFGIRAAVDREEKLLKIGRLADNCACYTCADIKAILEGK